MRATTQAVAHGTFNGAMSGIQGGKFWNGFAAGAISSAAASLFGGGQNHDGTKTANGKSYNYKAGTGYSGVGHAVGMDNAAGMIAFGTIAGGAGASLSGGNFWQGAVTGLVVSGLNHAMHQGDDGDPPAKKNIIRKFSKEQLDSFKTEFGMGVMEYVEGGGLQLISKGIKIINKSSFVSKTVVIGEDMAGRVLPFAQKNGFKYFKPRGTNPANWMKNQSKWIYKQIKDPTVRIIDIGSKGLEATSKYYIKELEMIKKYINH